MNKRLTIINLNRFNKFLDKICIDFKDYLPFLSKEWHKIEHFHAKQLFAKCMLHLKQPRYRKDLIVDQTR